MKEILTIVAVFHFLAGYAQPCLDAQKICNGVIFPLNQNALPEGLPFGLNISNPTGTSLPVGNPGSGCLLSQGTYPNWFVFNVATGGNLEFTIGQAGSVGFYDWALWPFDQSDPQASCNAIMNDQQPPVACNWNGVSEGFTGMWNGGTPPGGAIFNFVPSIPVQAGEGYIILFSNFSGLAGQSNIFFPSNLGSANISCVSTTPDYTICIGSSANVTLVGSQPITSANWLVTDGVSNTSGITDVLVTPTTTTEYIVEINMSGTIVNDTFIVTVVTPPVPDAGPDQTVCFGTPITLSGNTPTFPVTGNWQVIAPPGMTPPATASFSPNFSSPTPTVTVSQPGAYQFIWKQTSTACGTYSDTVVITVVEVPITTTQTMTSCSGLSDGSITITSSSAVAFSFDGGTNWGASNAQNGFAAGTYSVCAKNAMGCQKCINVTITDPISVDLSLSNDTIICQNGTATITATATGGTSFTFHWNHVSSTVGTQNVNPVVDTYYPVFAENQAGCISEQDSILVSLRAPLSGSLIPPSQTVCPGSVSLTTSNITGGLSPYSFVWSTGYTNSGMSSSITEPINTPTTYTVVITDACESSPLVLTSPVGVHPLPVPQITVDEPVKCEPAVFTITNTTDPNMVASTVWNTSNGQQFIDQNQIVPQELYAGTYDVQLIITSPDGCIDSTTFLNFLTVLPKPEADFKWSPEPVTMFNTHVDFFNYSTGADTYQWSIPGGTPSASTQENAYTMYPDGVVATYQVMLISTSYLGCTDTVIKDVPVYPEVLLYAPNTFTPDNDEFNQNWKVEISGIDETNFELLIFDRWGEIIWESHDVDAAWDGTYHGRIIPQGTYMWTIRTKDFLNDKKYEFKGHMNVIH